MRHDVTAQNANPPRHLSNLVYVHAWVVFCAGKIADEEAVLKWLTDDKTLELPDQIEEVNGRMLKKFIDDDSDDVVAFYCESDGKIMSCDLASITCFSDLRLLTLCG